MGEQAQIEQFKKIKTELTRFLMMYKFALDEIETKVEILKEEFQSLHDYSPIEHTKSRLKSPESIMKKIYRKNSGISLHEIKKNIKDIAGLRITCSFISDIYRVKSMLENQDDLTILEIKDYIRYPKPNGYKSLHMLVEVPVFMSDRQERVCVEIQIRTIAMDFWASLEHKIFYKYNQSVPEHLLQELKAAADAADELDRKMERLHTDIKEIKENNALQSEDEFSSILVNNRQFRLPAAFLDLIGEGERGIK
ncbi:GTP pyrophosphokinase family protein [Paenibacillus terreus]|uniref:GTP pyrophosphokinase family protein n=1 Tax=Paenibacillus terreus TaxID=1387834 RepID=A0ABV5B569_9BACL